MTLFITKFLFHLKKATGTLSPLEQLVGFPIDDETLFKRAFIHKGNNESYERLEFLGDAVLDSVISEWLYYLYPNKAEGDLTILRSRYVSRVALAKFAQSINLHQFIQSDRVSFRKIDDKNQRILGDVLESLIGAIYLAKGYPAAQKFIHQHILENKDILTEIDEELKNYKGLLLEMSQINHFDVSFEFDEPYNGEYYLVTLYVNGKKLAYGRGKNKKKAEQSASRYVINHPNLLEQFA